MSATVAVMVLGAIALVGEVVLTHLRERADSDRLDAIESMLLEHEHRLREVERWRQS